MTSRLHRLGTFVFNRIIGRQQRTMGSEKRNKLFTLAFIMRNDEVLLGLKKRGFGQGKWNGFGGKVNPGEAIEDATIREIEEECSLKVDKKDLTFVGVNYFEFVGDPIIMEVHIFKCHLFKGEPLESEEMRPKFFKLNDIPYKLMWADDEIWYPLFLQDGIKFNGYFLFEGHSKILSYKVSDFNDPSIVLKEQN